VIIGAPEGKKELVGLADGVRESAESWRDLLLDLKRRGLSTAPQLALPTARSASGKRSARCGRGCASSACTRRRTVSTSCRRAKMVDATIVPVPKQPNTRAVKAALPSDYPYLASSYPDRLLAQYQSDGEAHRGSKHIHSKVAQARMSPRSPQLSKLDNPAKDGVLVNIKDPETLR
jgi:hypothetical protein